MSAVAKSRFRPNDPDAIHRRFEEIRSRVTRRLDDEWQRLVRGGPRLEDRDMPHGQAPPAPRTASRRAMPRKRA